MRSKGIHYSLAVLVSIGALALPGCGGGDGDGDSARLAQTVDASKNGVTSIALAETDGSVHIKGKLQFDLIGTADADKSINLNNKATWQLSDTRFGSIKNGLFTPSGKMPEGNETLTVTASYAGKTTPEQIINLSDANLTSIEVTHPTRSVDVCKNTTFSARTRFSDDKDYAGYPLTWSLSDNASSALASFADENLAELSTKKSGQIYVVAKGKDNDGKIITSPEFQFDISDSLTKLTLTSDRALEMRQGQTATVVVTAEYRDSASENIIKNASLTSSNTSALTVNPTSGLITATNGSFAGTDVTLSASCNGITSTLVIKVTKPELQKMEIVSNDSTSATESLSVSVGSSVEPRIKVTYPTTTGIDPEIYMGNNAEWEIINTPTGYDSSKVTLNAATGKVTISSAMILDSSIVVTLSAKLLDNDNRILISSDGTELRDTIQLTINR